VRRAAAPRTFRRAASPTAPGTLRRSWCPRAFLLGRVVVRRGPLTTGAVVVVVVIVLLLLVLTLHLVRARLRSGELFLCAPASRSSEAPSKHAAEGNWAHA
jgi:hypothetical protein